MNTVSVKSCRTGHESSDVYLTVKSGTATNIQHLVIDLAIMKAYDYF
jgi:hypothetical protein